MPRLFAAIAIPDDIGQPLLGRMHGLDGARWRPLEALHITLRFYGDVKDQVARDLDDALTSIASAPFGLTLDSVGAFGEGRDIHAVWAGVAESEPLRALAAKCETAARRVGLKTEGRRYTPHVTMAYLRRVDPAFVATWLEANALLKSPTFAVDRFGLYSSHQTGEGSRYRLEAEYRL
ncbi:MAG: RNA 2',3'-cyclic phosphodiesterase [Pseudomonadota bacterium]